MVPGNRERSSLYDEAKAGLSSLFKQTAQVFVGLVVMLLLTGGNPPAFVVTLSVILGIGFVAWSEQKRIAKLKKLSQEHQQLVQRLIQSETEDFFELAIKAELNPDKDFVGIDLVGLNLAERNFRGLNLSEANLSQAYLYKTNFQGAKLSKANLSDANLRGTNLSKANLSNANLSNTNLINANLRGANLCNTNLISANLCFATLSEANIKSTNLSEANLSFATLIGANLKGINFRNSNLEMADLRNANLQDVDFFNADVTKTRFGKGIGLSKQIKLELKKRGAIFDDLPNDRSEALIPV